VSDVDTFQGDCREVLACLEADSLDAVVTDPPYELGFMGKGWDRTGVSNDPATWAAVMRVMKPGAYLLAFGGTRTYHRMVCAIEDAGFEIRDSLHWIYGTGFPKSMNVGGGRGTALKPAHEPIVLARKPLTGILSANALAHGTGALNVDACRIAHLSERDRTSSTPRGRVVRNNFAPGTGVIGVETRRPDTSLGRWPANILLDEDAAAELDAQSGPRKSGAAVSGNEPSKPTKDVYGEYDRKPFTPHTDSGGASRFFYVAKASRSERDRGCDSLPFQSGGEVTGGREEGSAGLNSPRAGAGRTSGARNIHPTVKPVALMRWLVRLVTPVGGTVLDPFMGSGTTGIAAKAEDRNFIGIEMQADYLAIAEARIGAA
jgi:site-specific DNA-methyltransferase (adenine-specific)